ncbi:NAD(P)H-hydrate dehydratase [Candidatus Fermentibacteria bacterium]|nr:NAD(P)H-hydrate dehydratase [Candidatus Fermentibacteria bacterium]
MACWWVTPEEMALFDRRTISAGTPAEDLMEQAGAAVFKTASRMTSPGDGPVAVFCGPGNNGGDGFVTSRLLMQAGYDVRAVLAAESASSISPLCMKNLVRFRDSGGTVMGTNRVLETAGAPALVIDALLGTGLRGPLTGVFAACAQAMAGSGAPVLAVDTPSGIDGATGLMDPLTPRAAVTVCLGAVKAGLLLPPGCSRAGSIFLADIGIGVDERPDRELMDFAAAAGMLPPRPVDAHKNLFGRLMLIGGSEAMPGAAMLMTMGALRAGAGLVHLFVPYPAAPAVSGRIPEALSGYFLPGDVTSLPDPASFDVVAAGPGMGAGVDTSKIVRHVLFDWDKPVVLDADGLNVLEGSLTGLAARKSPSVLTPHPGELRRMTGGDWSGQQGAWDIAASLAKATGSVVLLKGRPTMVFSPTGRRMLVPTGNSGLATGGSGDVLTGVIAALMGQGAGPFEAAALGAFIHGLSADLAVTRTSGRSLLPSDVADAMGRAFLLLEHGSFHGLVRLEGRWNGRLWPDP